jgi:arylsulfatase A
MRWLTLALLAALGTPPRSERPNIVFILADDLGWGELGCYGQAKIRTPHLDRLAAQGVRFTQLYAGNAVCAPSRCSLMTGLHPGHAHVRNNREVQPEGQAPLPGAAVTVAEVLKGRGYATAAIGKWGLGGPGTEGDPNRQGFDLFYGYNCQRHAHNHYPSYLWKNDRRIELDGKTYSHDLFEKESLDFVRSHKDGPFFLYLPFTIPHVAMQIPDEALDDYKGWDDPPYEGGQGYTPHSRPRAAHAAMISRMDRSVGRLLDLLAELQLEKDTLVIFTSDNGSIDRAGGHDLKFFAANGPFRGEKGQLYEGGIRVPFIARWPGRLQPGTLSDRVGAFWDILPTLAAAAGADTPKQIDGLDLLGPARHEFLYWEFPGYGGQQAVRLGSWKGIRTDLLKGKVTPLQLYDLAADPGETTDLAARNPEVVARIEALMRQSHEPSALFPMKALDGP